MTFITVSDDEKDLTRPQLARIRHALRRKRDRLQQSNANFIAETSDSISKRRWGKAASKESTKPAPTLDLLSTVSGDPFESLAVNAGRLTELLHPGSSRQAGEPIFSVNDTIVHQGLRSVLKSGFEDAASCSALCMTLAFAAKGWTLNEEIIGYETALFLFLFACFFGCITVIVRQRSDAGT